MKKVFALLLALLCLMGAALAEDKLPATFREVMAQVPPMPQVPAFEVTGDEKTVRIAFRDDSQITRVDYMVMDDSFGWQFFSALTAQREGSDFLCQIPDTYKRSDVDYLRIWFAPQGDARDTWLDVDFSGSAVREYAVTDWVHTTTLTYDPAQPGTLQKVVYQMLGDPVGASVTYDGQGQVLEYNISDLEGNTILDKDGQTAKYSFFFTGESFYEYDMEMGWVLNGEPCEAPEAGAAYLDLAKETLAYLLGK